MTSTTTQLIFPHDFFPKIIESSTAMAVEWIQAAFKIILNQILPYWPYIFGGLFILFMIATAKALLGQVGMLGSLLYHIFYIITLGVIILIGGFGLFYNPFFDLICFATYRFCYWAVGLILHKIKTKSGAGRYS